MEIYIKIKTIMPDRSTYKKYGVLYEPENLYLSTEISDEEVSVEGNNYFVTEEGLKAIVSNMADLVDEIDNEHLIKLNKQSK